MIPRAGWSSIRAVVTSDFVTSDFHVPPYFFRFRTRLTCVYGFTIKPDRMPQDVTRAPEPYPVGVAHSRRWPQQGQAGMSELIEIVGI